MPPSDSEQIAFEELVARANGYAFYIFAYEVLSSHGLDFKTLPLFPNLTDAWVAGDIDSALYYYLLSEALREAVQAATFERATVPDVGHA